MRTLHLLIAAFAVFQCLRYGRTALRFVSPPGGEGRRAYLFGFLITLVALALLASALLGLLREPAPG